MARILVTIVAGELERDDELTDFLEERGWRHVGDGRWQALFSSSDAADKQTTRDLVDVQRRLGDLELRVQVRHLAFTDPVPRSVAG